MIYPDTQLYDDQSLAEQATRVALLAFRCARHHGEKRDIACEIALKAYLDIFPNDDDASDRVIVALAEALERHPHWMA